MRLLYLLLLTTLSTFTARTEPLHLELGEDFTLPISTRKVWIEDKKLLRAEGSRHGMRIKAQRAGLTRIRIDGQLRELRVSEAGTKKNFLYWKLRQSRFAGIHTEYCGEFVCLRGSLYRLQDYHRLLNLIKSAPATTYLALQADPSLQSALQMILNENLRSAGLAPMKLILQPSWLVYLPKEKYSPDVQLILRSFGIQAKQLTNAVNTDENIKVSVRILEVSKNFERKYGVQWPDQYEARLINWLPTSENSGNIDLALNAAEKSGEARILAAPTLICRNGKEAEFFAGGEFPVRILGHRSQQTAWKRYGISLKLKPRVDPLGQLSLSVETEVSTLDRSILVDDMPALHSNRIASVFDLIGGRTIAISGLLKSEQSENSEGLPWLKNIPVLGTLFSSRNFQTNKSELIILVTPSLME